jgi:cytochrome c biogenesis protein CcdA
MKIPFLNPNLSRRLLLILAASFVLSLTLELYVFGFPEDFFGRFFRTWFFLFTLIAGSALVIIPLVNRLVNRWVK